MMFNLLNFAAVIVLVGLTMATIRRITNAGERATQTFMEDILPLILIFAVAATGLMLTVSYKRRTSSPSGLIAQRIPNMWGAYGLVSAPESVVTLVTSAVVPSVAVERGMSVLDPRTRVDAGGETSRPVRAMDRYLARGRRSTGC